MSQHVDLASTNASPAGLDFLWMEVTNRCNLECVHCYANSSPRGKDSALTVERQMALLAEAYDFGCRRVQFIGGEPTLNRSLPLLIKHARELEFEFIEVYSNLVAVSDDLLECFKQNDVHLATSIYSNRSATHDFITTRPGSFVRTTDNIRRAVARGIRVRASIIEMGVNSADVDSTRKWLAEIGITDVGSDRLRRFGRGNTEQNCTMSELCGSCAGGTLCIGGDGIIAPCIMSKAWPIGDASTDALSTILASSHLRGIRQAIHGATQSGFEYTMGGCQPDSRNPCGPDCGPSRNCMPCSPNTNCGPNSCRPK